MLWENACYLLSDERRAAVFEALREQVGVDASAIWNADNAVLLRLARKALHQFPNIGAPGAEKILMFCGMAPGLPLEWNGLRVLTRVGYGRSGKNYGAMYKSVQEAIAPELPRAPAAVSRAHLLLREHGKKICRNNGPLCQERPIAGLCAFANGRQRQEFKAT